MGVGLLAKAHIPCRRAPILPQQQPQSLWASARWAPYDIPLPRGKQLRVYTLYGLCNSPTRNNAFLQEVFEEAATSTLPTLIVGDLNAGFEAGTRASPPLDAAILSGRYIDLMYPACEWKCRVGNNRPTRIDHALATQSALPLILCVSDGDGRGKHSNPSPHHHPHLPGPKS